MGATRGALTWKYAAAAGEACCAAGTQRRQSAEAVTRSMVGCRCASGMGSRGFSKCRISQIRKKMARSSPVR